MPNENQNNINSWKIKLDELNSLPGEPITDKNVLWSKLDARLREKKTDKKPAWYWIAAACFLFALMIPMIFFNKKERQLTKAEIKQVQPEIKNPLNSTAGKKDSIKNIIFPLPKKNTEIVQKKTNKIPDEVIAKKQSNQFRLAGAVSTKDLMIETKNTSLQPIGISPGITAIAPVKKKLKVVHINELGDPVKESPDVVTRQAGHSFQLKFAGQEMYSNPSAALDKTGFTILKIKAFSN